MIHFVSLLILAFAVSVDSFGVGITYGMRKITIPIRSIFIIALCSGLMILLAMSIGQGISRFFSPSFAGALGSFILICVGLWALYSVSRKPMMADLDHSGVISPGEAFVLGTALALDAFGAGIGAALVGFSPLGTALIIALMSGLFIYLGMKFGVLFAEASWLKKSIFFPGIILIALGIIKLL